MRRRRQVPTMPEEERPALQLPVPEPPEPERCPKPVTEPRRVIVIELL